MSAFLFTFWRFGWARDGYGQAAIGGWRRVLWRLWWRLPAPPAPAPLLEQRPEVPTFRPPAGAGPLHWCADQSGIPFCGAPSGKRVLWTIDFKAATCEACVAGAFPLITKRRLNDR